MSKSVYKYSAESGLPVGLYLTAISFCFLLSLDVPFLPLLIMPLVFGFPFLLGWQVRRMAVAEPSYRKVSALWLCGIYSVIFGSMICALFSALYLVFVNPSFLEQYVVNALSVIEASPVAPEYADEITMMHRALDMRMIPGGMQFVASVGWLTCFAGSLLSLAIAFILSRSWQRKAFLVTRQMQKN